MSILFFVGFLFVSLFAFVCFSSVSCLVGFDFLVFFYVCLFLFLFVCCCCCLFVCFSVGFDFIFFIYVSLLFCVCGVCVFFWGEEGVFLVFVFLLCFGF